MTPNGAYNQHWLAAEVHFQKMSREYVIPCIIHAQHMAARPWYPAQIIAGIINVLRDLEAVRRLYEGPISRRMEGQLSDADKVFRECMKQLNAWDK